MRPRPLSSFAMLVVPLSLLCALQCEAALTADDESEFAKVRDAYTASRRAIESVECAYVYKLNGMERRCAWARSGDKFYHASVDILPEQRRGLPREVAWDGQRGFSRAEIGELIRGRSRDIASTTCDTPDLGAFLYVDQPLGFRPEPKHRFKFRAARQLRTDRGECVDLHFDMESTGGTVISRHARELGYLPIGVEAYDRQGRILYKLEEIDYERKGRAGNLVFFPVRSTGVSYVDGKPANTVVVEVDRSTLRINEPIDAARFVLKPWPIDLIYDADTQKATARRDPTWLPLGKVGFPWDVFFESQSPTKWAADFRVKFQPDRAAGTPAPVANEANGGTSAMVAQSVPAPADTQKFVWWSVLALGVLLVVGAVVWNFRQHRRTA